MDDFDLERQCEELPAAEAPAPAEPLAPWSPSDDPEGACGGGECEWDNGQWFPCQLHLRAWLEVRD